MWLVYGVTNTSIQSVHSSVLMTQYVIRRWFEANKAHLGRFSQGKVSLPKLSTSTLIKKAIIRINPSKNFSCDKFIQSMLPIDRGPKKEHMTLIKPKLDYCYYNIRKHRRTCMQG